MRVWCVYALIVALGAVAFGAVRRPDRELAGLKGAVRKVTVEATVSRIDETGATTELRREPVETVLYNEKGDMVERRVFSQGRLYSTTTYSYVAEDARIARSDVPPDVGFGIQRSRLKPGPVAEVELVRDPSGAYVFLETFVYTAAGKLLESALYAGDKPDETRRLSKVKYSLDAKGRVNMYLRLAGRPEAVVERINTTYGRDDVLGGELRYGPGNVPLSKRSFTYEFDPQGNWIKQSELTVIDSQQFVVTRTRTIEYAQ